MSMSGRLIIVSRNPNYTDVALACRVLYDHSSMEIVESQFARVNDSTHQNKYVTRVYDGGE